MYCCHAAVCRGKGEAGNCTDAGAITAGYSRVTTLPQRIEHGGGGQMYTALDPQLQTTPLGGANWLGLGLAL